MVPWSYSHPNDLRLQSLPQIVPTASLEEGHHTAQSIADNALAALHVLVEVMEIDQAKELVKQVRLIIERA